MTIKQPSSQQPLPIFLTRRELKQRLNEVLTLLQQQPGEVVTIRWPYRQLGAEEHAHVERYKSKPA